MSDKRYPDLPPETRTFLEKVLTPQRLVKLQELIVIYERVPSSVWEFLERANPITLKWLQDARPEEIKQLEEGIRLVGSLRLVGKFVKWAVITIVGAFIGAVALGKSLSEFLSLWKGGR